MSDDDDSGLSLTAEMVNRRARGYDFVHIAEEFELSAAEVHQRVHAYLRDNFGAVNATEQRMLQLKRLEMLVNVLWDQVSKGDYLTEGKQTKNFIDALTEITNLMNLKHDPLRDELVELTRAQTEMLYTIIDAMREELRRGVVSVIRDLPDAADAQELRSVAAAKLESRFPAIYAEAADRAHESAKNQQPASVRIGGKGKEDT